MIVEYIRYNLRDQPVQTDLVAAYEVASKPLRASPHCIGYELTQCGEDPAVFVLRILWDSAEGHMQGFRRSAEFREFYQAISRFIPNIEEMRHYSLTSVRWVREGPPR